MSRESCSPPVWSAWERRLWPAFSSSASSCSAGGVLPILRAGSREESARGPLQVSVALATACRKRIHHAWQPTQHQEVQILQKAVPVLNQSPPHVMAPLPCPALGSHRASVCLSWHLPLFLFPPGLCILSSFGSQFFVPSVKCPSFVLILFSSVSDLLTIPLPEVRERKGEEIQGSSLLLPINGAGKMPITRRSNGWQCLKLAGFTLSLVRPLLP